jgi:hypothetical protein
METLCDCCSGRQKYCGVYVGLWVHLVSLPHFLLFTVLRLCILEMTVFWVVAPCSLVEVYRRLRGACCLHYRFDDGGSNVGKLLPDYTAQQPRRQSSYSPP